MIRSKSQRLGVLLCSRIGKTLDNQCVRLAGGDFFGDDDESEEVDC